MAGGDLKVKGATNVWTLSSIETGQPVEGAAPIAPGVAGQGGPAGPVDDGESGAGERLNLLLGSFEKMMPGMSVNDMQDAILFATEKIQGQIEKNTEGADINEQKLRQAIEAEQQAQEQQALQEQQQAAQDAQGSSIWDKVKLAFQYLAAAVSIAVGAVLCATGVGAAIGALMIAGGALGLVGAVNSTVQATTGGEGILGHVVDALGGSKSQVAQADEGFAIALAVSACVAAVASAGVGIASFVSAGSEVADAGTDAAEIADATEEVSKGAQVSAKVATTVGDGVNGATQVATGTGDIVVGDKTYKGAQAQAQADRDQASALLDGALAEIVTSVIKQMGQDETAVLKSVAAAISQLFEAVASTGSAVDAAAKFAKV